MRKKATDFDDDGKVKSTILYEQTNTLIDRLFFLYKEDKLKARIFFMSNSSFSRDRIVLFERSDNNFQIVRFSEKFGISSTNKIYKHQSQHSSIIVKDNKFWFRFKRNKEFSVSPLCYNHLNSFYSLLGNKLPEFFKEKFLWISSIQELKGIADNISFNTIIKKKLLNERDVLKYKYKCDYPTAKVIHEADKERGGRFDFLKFYQIYKKHVKNIDKMKDPSNFSSGLFQDTVRMAKILGREVNGMWSAKRLVDTHNKWAKEITNVLLEGEEERQLFISKIFAKFAYFSNYKLLKTNKEILAEGMLQQHCVGSYINKVERGSCAIFSIDGYTLETTSTYVCDGAEWYYKILIAQFNGFRNRPAPEGLKLAVQQKIDDFNNLCRIEKNNLPSVEVSSTRTGYIAYPAEHKPAGNPQFDYF